MLNLKLPMVYIKKITCVIWIAGVALCCKSKTEKEENHSAATEIKSDTTSNIETDTARNDNFDKAWLIIPSKSIGKTEINQNADLVFKNLGKPDGGDAAMGKSVAIWYANHDSTGHSTSIYTTRDMGNNPTALIRQIRVTSPVFKTKENLGAASDLSEIEKTFDLKVVESFMDSGKQYKIYDAKEGIAFEIGPNKKCVAVIVHEAGKTIPGMYLKFRTTNRFINKTNQ
jgi:hypothetical protein